MKLYIAGSILSTTDHRDNFSEAEIFLKRFGYQVVNPINVTACPDKRCWQLGTRLTPWLRGPNSREHSYECYIRYDLIEMFKCDGVAYMPGWEISFGARNEINQAAMCGMPVKAVNWWASAAKSINKNPDSVLLAALNGKDPDKT